MRVSVSVHVTVVVLRCPPLDVVSLPRPRTVSRRTRPNSRAAVRPPADSMSESPPPPGQLRKPLCSYPDDEPGCGPVGRIEGRSGAGSLGQFRGVR